MRERTVRIAFIATVVLAAGMVPALGQDDHESPSHFAGVWYRISVDGNGDYISGDGHGLGWFYYPESDVYRMWFHNGPYDPNRQAFLDYHVYTKAVDPTKPTYADVGFGWTTPEWSALGYSGPPLPEDLPTAHEEFTYIAGDSVYTVDGPVLGSAETIRGYTVDKYNPEWVSIVILARNAYIYRGAFHECVPKGSQLGACCNKRTGYCYMTYRSNCASPSVWLGFGSTCDQCVRDGTAGMDFGDAPESYRTLLASDGPRHWITPGVFLGGTVDNEANGRPNATATGDDKSGADEDGVVFASTLHAGREAQIEVTASTDGYLNAWIDFDGDGRFDNPRDQIFADQIMTFGINRLSFPVPADAVAGWTFARFRFNTRGLLDSFGPADDGEVEDYRVQIVMSHEPQAASGAARLAWNQPPLPAADDTPLVFQGGSATSALHLHEIAADDWQLQDGRPITGIHWWGTFDGWTERYLPAVLPVAFHLGVWTNVPDPLPYNFETFAHPGTLIWETYCTNWTWAVSGQEASDDGTQPGPTCFLFSHLLSQDQWFPAQDDLEGTIYWLSVAALYDSTGAETPHPWAWKIRPVAAGAAGASVKTIVPPANTATWPPVIGAQWETGSPIRDLEFKWLDLAFQFTTYVPLEFEAPVQSQDESKADAAEKR